MGLLILLSQVVKTHVRIPLRGRQPGVPEQFLNAAQVRSSLQKVGCKAVPQRMGRDPAARGKTQTKTRNKTLDIAGTQAPRIDADENRLIATAFSFVECQAISFLQVFGNRPRRKL